MKLITKEIQRKLPPLYANESKQPQDVPVVLKLFNPYGSGTWYITEASVEGDDVVMFGLCSIQEAELGYVSLNELQSLRKFGRPQIERDRHWEGTLADAMRIEGYAR